MAYFTKCQKNFHFLKSFVTIRTQTTTKFDANPKSNPDTLPENIPKLTSFIQTAPKLQNRYDEDAALQQYLRRMLPNDVLTEIEPDLKNFGFRVSRDIYEHGLECERNPPQLVHFDAWGNRVDRLILSESWKKMNAISAEEGLVAIAYERRYGQWSRIYQMVKTYLFSLSSGFYSCPLSMTDGAAKTIEDLNLKQLNHVFRRLISRDPGEFWTSGQWMTEKQGGSDVGNGTETVAIPQTDGSFKLYGYKWFSSATDSDVTFTLARIANEDNSIVPGSKGLSMFYLEVRDDEGKLNKIEIVKLKNKLGTKQVPTAELILNGSVASLVSPEGKGVKSISNMLNITRLHNAIADTAAMRGIINMARDYGHRRIAFGTLIIQHPLYVTTLAEMDLEARGAIILVLEATKILGLQDCGDTKSHEVLLLRLLTPLLKLYTAKQAMAVVSEGLEAFGGQGYIEDTGLPRILRDTQVTPIWEGTTNILSLDVLRVFAKQPEILSIFREDVLKRLSTANAISELQGSVAQVKAGLEDLMGFLQQQQDKLLFAARDLAFSITNIYIGTLLIEHAAWKGSSEQDRLAAIRWNQKNLVALMQKSKAELYSGKAMADNEKLVLDGYTFIS